MNKTDPQFFTLGQGTEIRSIAYRLLEGQGPTLVWLGGFMSDMLGSKAETLAGWAAQNNRALLRFDYSCHGESGGDVMQGCISRWSEEAEAIIAAKTQGPVLLIGSSMGGWIALRLAQAMLERGAPAKAMVLIAPAPDFTDKLMWPSFPDSVKAEIMEKGFWKRPSPYSDGGYIITKKLIEDGKTCSVLDNPIKTGCPVHILQGMNDEDVPYQHSLRLISQMAQDDVTLTLIKDGDHRLSRPDDLKKLIQVVSELS